jgi:hypothetical protein
LAENEKSTAPGPVKLSGRGLLIHRRASANPELPGEIAGDATCEMLNSPLLRSGSERGYWDHRGV